jgi:hypothetical protein
MTLYRDSDVATALRAVWLFGNVAVKTAHRAVATAEI